MFIGESLRTTFSEVWSHKLRSSLTLVGVVLGTFAVVFMVTLIEAVKVEVWNGIESLGLNGVLFVSADTPASNLDMKRSHLSEGLRLEDAEAVVGASEQIAAAAPAAFTQQVIAWGDASRSTRITGTTPQYAVVMSREADKGRYLSDLDLERKRRVVFLGHLLAEELFDGRESIGQWVRIGHHRFEVIGVGARMGNDFVSDGWSRREMQGATIPLTTMQTLYGGGERVPTVVVKVANTDGLSALFAHLKNIVWRQHNRVEDFEIENVAAEILDAEKEIDEQLRGWTIVLFSISAISLVVGGVGIFSVLQISLAERDRGGLLVRGRCVDRLSAGGHRLCGPRRFLRGRSADFGLRGCAGDHLCSQHRARRRDLPVPPRGSPDSSGSSGRIETVARKR
jgi:putative ABC transport system permease protein